MMQYENYHDICSQGTQTKLSTSSKDDVLVSFSSTCSLLSSTFSQFMLEVSRTLHLPVDEQKPLISVEKLLSEFKARSLEMHNLDRTELSFHSPLVPTSPDCVSPNDAVQAELQKLEYIRMEGVLDSYSTSPSNRPTPVSSPFHLSSPLPPSTSGSINSTPQNLASLTSTQLQSGSVPAVSTAPQTIGGPSATLSASDITSAVTSQENGDDNHLSSSPFRIPVIPVPAKITKEHADSTNRISPPLPLSEMSIGMPGRSAFCKPMPKQVSPSATQQTGATSTQIKLEPSTPPANAKSETELFECLQKLQNCCEKYMAPSTLPFSLNNILHGIRSRDLSSSIVSANSSFENLKPTYLPNIKPQPLDSLTPAQFDNIKAAAEAQFENLRCKQLENLKTAQLQGFKLPLPTTFQFLERGGADPNLLIKAMQDNNPLLKNSFADPAKKLSPLFNSPMKCPYCELTFHKKSHLSNHLVQLHSHSYHCCRQCKISFPDRLSLEHHQRSHPKQQFQCTGCNLSFKTGSELKRHVKTHTQERAFMCDICGSRFNLKHNLKAHMRQHTGERPFRCKICNRGFTRSNNLKRHLYAHCSSESTQPAATVPRSTVLPNDHILSMIPNMVMFDAASSNRLPGVPVQGEVRVD